MITIKEALQAPFAPERLLAFCNQVPELRRALSTRVRHYTVEQHTLLVLRQFERYFEEVELSVSRDLFRIMLALHDSGKGLAFSNGNRHNQHQETVQLIQRYYTAFSLSEQELMLIIALTSTDVLGLYFQGKLSLQAAVAGIWELSEKAQMTNTSFFQLLLIYYQVDVASYTKDAGGFPFLENVFIYDNGAKAFDPATGLLKFSAAFAQKLAVLKNAMLTA
jgi:hypothetical protein